MTDHAKELRRHADKIGRPSGDVPAVMHAAAAHIEDLERRLREAEDLSAICRTATPFSIAIDKRQVDRAMQPGRAVLTVWVPAGKTLELPLEICV